MSNHVIEIATQAYQDQKPGTSGLRKKVSVFQQPNYLENFIQAIYEATDKPKVLVLGGDGRFFMKEAIDRIINVLAANQILKIIIPMNGLLSTPAASCLIRSAKASGGIILTASHNPGGPDGDFGIKFNTSTGSPAPEAITEKIYERSKTITSYKSLFKKRTIDLSKYSVHTIDDTRIAVIDPIANYMEVIKDSFDFGLLKETLQQEQFKIIVDCMNGVTGPYAKHIFLEKFRCPTETVINYDPLPDFGGKHPDPNLTIAKDLVNQMKADPTIQFGIAFDGDGDRNMVLGQEGFFVSPGDALAVIADNADCIDQLSKCKGFARSFPTAPAIDRVAAKRGLVCHEVPTGWKYFGELLSVGRIQLCGEESFGLGASHCNEKDGMWACLAWLSILSKKRVGVKQLVEEHWKVYGRDYFNRYDFEECDSVKCQAMMRELETLLTGRSLVGRKFGSKEQYEVVETGNFAYTSPTGVKTPGQGLFIKFTDGSRIIVRLSGTGSSGATVRIYLNAYDKDDIGQDNETYLKELLAICYTITKLPQHIGTDKPTVIT